METSFIKIDDIKIVYREKNPQFNSTMFFIHGNSCSSNTWYKQFDDPVFKDYRLIAFDLPAHGNSSSLSDINSYNLLFFGKLMAGVIKALVRSEQNILAGFSFGANVVAEMLNDLPDLKGIALISHTIVGGNYTLNDTLKQGADPSVLFTDEPASETVTEYLHKAMLSQEQKDFSTCLEDFNAVKKPFRSMIFKTAIEGELSNEILNLSETGLPLFIAFGKEDSFVNPDYLDNANLILWNNRMHKINDAGHFLHLDQSSIFNNLLAGYCKAMI